MRRASRRAIVSLLFGCLFTALAFLAVWGAWNKYRSGMGTLIAEDVRRLSDIFKRINATAGIAGFKHQKNWINFLTVKKGGFVGSELGSMNLIYPDKWQGPYLNDNPTIQNKEYQVVVTDMGHFIVPGTGVTLPAGSVLGTTLLLERTSDVAVLSSGEGPLTYRGRPLASRIEVGGPTGTMQAIPTFLPEE